MQGFRAFLRAGDERIELPPKVLETPIIPFDQSPTLDIPSKPHTLHIYHSIFCEHNQLGQALDRLVTVNSTHHCASISALSTSSSLRGLSLFRVWISHLEGGFTLRCLQRLSLPVLATRPCHWHDNRSTSGRSIPVLSY